MFEYNSPPFRFEHRDLHEDNVLVKRTEDGVVESVLFIPYLDQYDL